MEPTDHHPTTLLAQGQEPSPPLTGEPAPKELYRTEQNGGNAVINNPTQSTYAGLNQAYAHFNARLFAGELPHCLITMQRHRGAYGYFSGDRFASITDPEQITDEIALNPSHFAGRTPTQTLSTLVHEMVHLWQHHFGKLSRAGYQLATRDAPVLAARGPASGSPITLRRAGGSSGPVPTSWPPMPPSCSTTIGRASPGRRLAGRRPPARPNTPAPDAA